MLLLQMNGINPFKELIESLPSFSTWIHLYGPYLGLVISLVLLIVVLQYRWYRRVVIAKDHEIKRLISREQDLHDRYLEVLDNKI